MLKLKYIDNGFEVYYKNRLVIRHTKKDNLITIGKANGFYKMGGGIYKIKEKKVVDFKLINYDVLAYEKNKIEILFEKFFLLLIENKIDYLSIKFINKSGNEFNRLRIKFIATEKEAIFGCGEQYTYLNLKNKKTPIWVEEQGVGRGHDLLTFLANVTHNGAGGNWHTTYFSQPSFVSSENYALIANVSAYSVFNFKKKIHDLYFWQIPEEIVYFVEDNLENLFNVLTRWLGRQPEIPDWVYNGIILGVQGGTNEIERKLNTALKQDVKVSALWAQDWEGRRITSFGKQLWWNWEYDKDLYPDLPSQIKSLNDRGIRFLGYINPFLAIEKNLYEIAKNKGYLIKNQDNTEYYVKVTTFPAAQIDLSNPEAYEWIKSIIKNNMINIGLSGWMADFAEYCPIEGLFYSKEKGELFHNKYPVLWAKANYEAVEESGKKDEIFYFHRSGYLFSQRYAKCIWAGDQMVNWSKDDGLPTVIVSAISMGFSGIGYIHSDIGGYTSVGYIKRTKELFMRWVEHSTFTMVMRTHESNRPDTNFQFYDDEECLKHLAKFTKIHLLLKPYLKKLSSEYQEKGLPPVRHICVHYPLEKKFLSNKYQYQYLLGRDLLVIPVYRKGVKKQVVYLPEDNWINLWTKKVYNGGKYLINADIGYPPVFYRKDSEFKDIFERII